MTNKELVEKLLLNKGVVCSYGVNGDYKYLQEGKGILWLGDRVVKDKSLLVALAALHCHYSNNDS